MCHKSAICSIKQLPINHFALSSLPSLCKVAIITTSPHLHCNFYSLTLPSASSLLPPLPLLPLCSCYPNRVSERAKSAFVSPNEVFVCNALILFFFFPPKTSSSLQFLSLFLSLPFALLRTRLHYSINFYRLPTDAFQLIQCTSRRRRE